ncbi:MAG: hypothetical protein IPM78_01835 [Moraxellaceae bacterium]|nr:hypothetical protein [Moraxellaceae bacterium]
MLNEMPDTSRRDALVYQGKTFKKFGIIKPGYLCGGAFNWRVKVGDKPISDYQPPPIKSVPKKPPMK